jgi:enamine deaminase RidA (YjgF/YER057c/UK114 family)
LSAFPELSDDVPLPLGNYLAVAMAGNLGFVSGQFPLLRGELMFEGRVGAELDIWQGREAAALAAANALGQMRKALGARFLRVRMLRVDGYVASAIDFRDQASVLDGASDTLVHYLGERGRHARGAFAVEHLPRNAAVELMVTFTIEPTKRSRARSSSAAPRTPGSRRRAAA